jgi:RNA polymerase sigma-70 factor, ECF subfamily
MPTSGSRLKPPPPPDEGALSDAILARQAQAHPAAFAPLYQRYRERVLAFCRLRLRDPAEAEDAASATFLKALQALPAFDDRADSFRSWLFRIAHNEVVDRQRRWARHPVTPLLAALTVADATAGPDVVAEAADDARRLRQLLAQLPPREQAVLALRAAGLPTAEIARSLGVSDPAVRTAQWRAIQRLRPHRPAAPTGAEEAVCV